MQGLRKSQFLTGLLEPEERCGLFRYTMHVLEHARQCRCMCLHAHTERERERHVHGYSDPQSLFLTKGRGKWVEVLTNPTESPCGGVTIMLTLLDPTHSPSCVSPLHNFLLTLQFTSVFMGNLQHTPWGVGAENPVTK